MNDLVLQQQLTPQSWAMLEAIAKTSSPSQIEQAKIARQLLFCFENSLPLSLAVNGGLYTVGDRVEAEGTTIRAQIRKHPRYDYEIARLDNSGCEIAITFDGELIGSASFTDEDAKRVVTNNQGLKLIDKDNYRNYPADMYLNRATSRAYKRFCPDIFFQSVYVSGEVSGNEVIIDQVTMQSLIDEFGSELVLEAMSVTQSSEPLEIREYLIEVE